MPGCCAKTSSSSPLALLLITNHLPRRRVRRRPLPAQPAPHVVSTDWWEGVGVGVGELMSRGFGAVRHQRNAEGSHGGVRGRPPLIKGWKSTAQCSKCSNSPSTYATHFLGFCRSAALAALSPRSRATRIRAVGRCSRAHRPGRARDDLGGQSLRGSSPGRSCRPCHAQRPTPSEQGRHAVAGGETPRGVVHRIAPP